MCSSDLRILVSSGVHGNELSSQIANLNLLNEFVEKELSHTVYFIPFVAPKASMFNERTFNERDLNRSAHIKNSLSSLIIQVIDDLKINFVGDFHTTAYNSNPGCEVIFSSKNPSPESFLIANYISNDVGCFILKSFTCSLILIVSTPCAVIPNKSLTATPKIGRAHV